MSVMFSLFDIIGACIDRNGPANPDVATAVPVGTQSVWVISDEAERHRNVLMEALDEWPSGRRYKPLAEGPSLTNIQLALESGVTDARELMAIGAVLGFWKIVQLHDQPGITGYQPATAAPALVAA